MSLVLDTDEVELPEITGAYPTLARVVGAARAEKGRPPRPPPVGFDPADEAGGEHRGDGDGDGDAEDSVG